MISAEVETARKPSTGLKQIQRILDLVRKGVETARKPSTGLKLVTRSKVPTVARCRDG